MDSSLWGLPVAVWVGLCLAVAAFYTILWPRPIPGEQRSWWLALLLRWGHALVWVLLAAAILAYRYVGTLPAQLLGIGGLALYIIFMAALVRRRPKPRA